MGQTINKLTLSRDVSALDRNNRAGVVKSADGKPLCDIKTGHPEEPPEEVIFEQRPKGGSDMGV